VNPAPLAALNLNALVALDALLSECNVTRAARRVKITQPAMSQTLARLRELFDDPLLVRKGRGMVRTPRAEAMMVPLAEALEAVERAVQLGFGFDPATSTRIFRLSMTDAHLTAILPGVLRAIDERAPEVRVQAEAMALSSLVGRIASGELDLAVGFLLSAAEGLRTETLLVDDYVCIVRRGHPLARGKRIRIEDYAQHRHLANTPVGFVPRNLSAAVLGFGASSRIRASVPYMLALPAMVRSTDLVATVPRRVLATPMDLDGLVTLEAPRELPKVEHSMWWHSRFDRDPAHQWLRERVREQFP
ncbi:MAG: LysR family transcriptional regulator, partial [Polyangiaceae bacterium]|nr:LysR family transcriptional regulator [Polyangiaceae bacterium]